jgi:5'-nucleotidase
VSWTLVTNDDGIDAPGLRALAAAAVDSGRRVVVAAPAGQTSGAGSSVIAERVDGRVPVQARELPGLADVPAYAVGAQPAFITLAALHGWFPEPPSLVLSGINEGANLGHAVLHSGTVGAALTAGRLGVRALAVSLDCDDTPPEVEPGWSVAAGLLPEVLDLLAATPPGTVLTLNVPDLPAAQLREPRAATLASEGRLRASVDNHHGGLGVRMIGSDRELEPGTDSALLAAGHPTLTALRSVTEDPTVPLAELLATHLDQSAAPTGRR